MILKAFSVYDSKALCFGVPFFMSSVGAAVRAFSDLSNDPQSTIFRHGSDYVLYEIGSYDDSVGSFNCASPHVHLGVGSDFVDRKLARDPVRAAIENPLMTTAELNGDSK